MTQLGVDAKANDDRLDTQLREELNAVTLRLGDELRAENVKTQEHQARECGPRCC